MKEALEHAAVTHNVVPLPAFDKDDDHITPEEYQQKLSGAVVEVHFGMMHYFIKQDKKSIFSAVVCQIIVLCPPVAPPVNPLKWVHLSDGPTLSSGCSTKKAYMVRIPIGI